MNLDNLNKWLSLTANIGVIAGILFLGVEVQQNSQLMRSQTRDSMTTKQMDYYASVYNDSELSNIRFNYDATTNEPSTEGFRYGVSVFANLRMYENEWYQYQQGLFEEEEFLPRIETWKRTFSNPSFRFVWEMFEVEMSPSFRNRVIALLEEIEDEGR